ncbi:AAA family ATPase [Coraliomargarita sp. SDUM461003]|uniref:AAA family ATPase n=1 Tax=Thalassobacterium maritimum TaxID=3041265 RepID=A0ABU1ARK7_9BACT|nr:AAA family ATPase [Coraliomargarita sp. SDUM461003]MDQ8206794.1 AAA family ATPase [Coraliomargarita sp. SDUM461003]
MTPQSPASSGNTASVLEQDTVAHLRSLPAIYEKVKSQLERRIIGQEDIIRDLFIALVCRGHCLMVGVPGLAKTLLVRSLAEIMDLDFQRIQFTPDLMPSDITGSEMIENTPDGQREFRFIKGPLFTQLLLADEINRTPPKTQAALLEAMQEQQVTVAGHTYALEKPFFVLATQNPIEQEGTYPLPEAQLDRFMFCLKLDYPSRSEEVDILLNTTTDEDVSLDEVITGSEILALQHAVRQVVVPQSVAEFAVDIVQGTRPQAASPESSLGKYIRWGAGPRACQYLALAGKAIAALDGRFNVAREDIAQAVPIVLRHRVLANYRAEADRVSIDTILADLVTSIK